MRFASDYCYGRLVNDQAFKALRNLVYSNFTGYNNDIMAFQTLLHAIYILVQVYIGLISINFRPYQRRSESITYVLIASCTPILSIASFILTRLGYQSSLALGG